MSADESMSAAVSSVIFLVKSVATFGMMCVCTSLFLMAPLSWPPVILPSASRVNWRCAPLTLSGHRVGARDERQLDARRSTGLVVVAGGADENLPALIGPLKVPPGWPLSTVKWPAPL